MIVKYKILHGLVNAPIEKVFFNATTTKTSCKDKFKEIYFAARLINDWNSLPSDIVMATNINSIKDVHWYNCQFLVL